MRMEEEILHTGIASSCLGIYPSVQLSRVLYGPLNLDFPHCGCFWSCYINCSLKATIKISLLRERHVLPLQLILHALCSLSNTCNPYLNFVSSINSCFLSLIFEYLPILKFQRKKVQEALTRQKFLIRLQNKTLAFMSVSKIEQKNVYSRLPYVQKSKVESNWWKQKWWLKSRRK